MEIRRNYSLTKHNCFHHPHTHRAWVRKLVDLKLLTLCNLKIIKSEFHGISGIFDSAKHEFYFKFKDLKMRLIITEVVKDLRGILS